MTIRENTFAAACYNQNSVAELIQALAGEADATDCATWNLTADEWRAQVSQALAAKADEVVIINYKQFVWPADKAQAQAWAEKRGQTVGESLPADPEGGLYRDLCDAVKPLGGLEVGTDACIDQCNALIEAGAQEWRV